MNNFTIGSFYTRDTAYERIINEYLISSVKKLNLDYVTLGIENTGNWNRNVAEKPKIIADLLKEGIDRLVFLDADAKVIEYPKLFDEIPDEYDIAYHRLNWNDWYGYKHTKPVMELLTGTMFFRNRSKVIELCEEWHENAIRTREWEQKILERIIGKYNLKTYELPIEYIYINSTPKGEPIVKVDRPVIVHYQKSRELKRRPI